jgi:hypothetical protein
MIEAGTPSAGSTISPAAYGNAKMFRERPRRGKQTFGILPPYDLDAKRASLRDVRLPRRVSRLLASIIVSLTFLGLYSLLEFESGGWVPTNLPWQQRLPPLYPEYRLRELALPQHNLDLPYPEGRNGKYLWISEHVRGTFHDACTPSSLPASFFKSPHFNSFRMGKRPAGTLCQCPAHISLSKSVSPLVPPREFQFIALPPVSCSITTHGIVKARSIQDSMET